MKPEIRSILLAAVIPLFFIFILYAIKVMEVGMDWDFTTLG
ncbi:MAG: rhomboid family intramembrane serine protease, partial [Bacteroidaceae bacterium]